MIDDEDVDTGRRERFDALGRALRLTLDGEGSLPVGRAHGVGFALLVDALPLRPGAGNMPGAHRPRDTERSRCGRVDADQGPSIALTGGRVTLRPAERPSRTIACPRRRALPGAEAPVEADLPADEACWLLAVASEHYDRGDVAGSEAWVILVPLARWLGHPALRGGGHRSRTASRGWEVFSPTGEPFGLILFAEGHFVGVDMSGACSPEGTLAGAAWQAAVNR